ncbi:MAG: hypothetical protein IT378_05180, partial [Sandaracinaceae bacterium]|nr:hypothetical protein [Sandaracinaceae bacterium]
GQQAAGMAQINHAMKDIDGALRENLGSIKSLEREAASLDELAGRLRALLAEHGEAG